MAAYLETRLLETPVYTRYLTVLRDRERFIIASNGFLPGYLPKYG
jgi:hypothetical protein